jgi:hypothetical protein
MFDNYNNPLEITAITYNSSSYNGIVFRDENDNNVSDETEAGLSFATNILSNIIAENLKYKANNGTGDDVDYIDLNLYSGSLLASMSINITIMQNNIPTIDTSFTDLILNENNGTSNYELNISDIENSTLTLSVESNDTSICQMPQEVLV